MAKTETPTTFKAVWPDGSTTEARSATEFILRVADAQWSPTTYQEMKNQLSKRGLAYPDGTRQFIEPNQPDEPFLMELFRIGMLTSLEVNGVPLERHGK
jgi:hypothetical protein